MKYKIFLSAILCFLFIALKAQTFNVCVDTAFTIPCASTVMSEVSGGVWSSSSTSVATVGSSTGIVTGISSGTAIISYSSSISGCGNWLFTVTINVITVPNVTITGASSVCAGSTITLTAASSGGIWSAMVGYVTVNSASGIVSGFSPGTDTVIYIDSNTCGKNTGKINITCYGIVGDIYTIGGNGTIGTSGDGGPAILGKVSTIRDMINDASGNLLMTDANEHVIRKIATNGIISIYAGTGTQGYTGDGGPATAAKLDFGGGGGGIYLDASGNVLISNHNSHVVRKINTSGIITTVAGTGSTGSSGDGFAATLALLNSPTGLCTDASGNIYICDAGAYKVRMINTSGIISTVIGTGSTGYSGDNYSATLAKIGAINDIVADNIGNLYVIDLTYQNIRKYNISSGIITTFAGTGTAGFSGDGGPATNAKINGPGRLAFDGSNTLYFTDGNNNRIRSINIFSDTINTFSGNGTGASAGDGGPASAATVEFYVPSGISVDNLGNLYIDDFNGRRIRKVIMPASFAILGNTTITSCGTTTLTDVSPGGTWTSSNTSVGTIDASTGIVTGIANGTTIISYTPPNSCGYIPAVTVNVSGCMAPPPGGGGDLSIPGTGVGKFRIMPNPTSGSLTISGNIPDPAINTNAEIRVFDLEGKTLYIEQLLIENGQINKTINLGRSIPNGMYLLKISYGVGNQVFRFTLDR